MKESNLSNFLYKLFGTVFGLSSFTVAPFLVFLWTGFEAPALVLVPLAMYSSFRLGNEIYDLSTEAESGYVETIQAFVALAVAIVFFAAISFEIYDWLS